jgi:rubrerythrin
MNTREEILEHLKEMLGKEVTALDMYEEISRSLENEQLKTFFSDFAKEEEKHVELVKELIALVKEGMHGEWRVGSPV